MESPRKILALKLRSLGDTVLMTAALGELRRAFPAAELHVAVLSPWAPLLEDFPGVHKVWTYDRHRERAARAKAAARLALRLRKQRFDCVVNFHASPSSAMISFATGAKLRSIHFHGHRDRNRYSTVTIPGKGLLKPIIERDLDAIRALGVSIPEGIIPMPSLAIPPDREKWRSSQPLLLLGLGASRPTKSWPIEKFAELAVRWVERFGTGKALALAGPDEAALGERFALAVESICRGKPEATALQARISVHSDLPIRELTRTLGAAAVFAGNDSGPKHLAVAMGTPTVTLFGPEHPFEWHPYATDRHPYLFIDHLACRKDALPGMPPWCALDTCVIERHKCMRDIGTDAVFRLCISLLGAEK